MIDNDYLLSLQVTVNILLILSAAILPIEVAQRLWWATTNIIIFQITASNLH